ncbi:MAG: KEOPS complex subunit Pcc1 [Candidatus Thermoplasmatota archaeon]|jgi:tRNA threonylcarbamoyladenosine modification (KEOPS) complex  Pcc1 subunit|nr:KEOPS complex subunit Pcc1 [Candidatus Thermoplasmatota archaeon]
MKQARFIFYFDSEDDVNVIVKSLIPEIKHKIPKTNVEVTFSGKTLFLTIETKDINSLRAACNSYLRWINTALNVKKTV